MVTKKTKSESEPEMRVLKTSTCPTLSGKSKLTYHIGVDPDSVIVLRVYSNSGGGAFSREWVAVNDVQAALDKRHEGSPVTAYLLQPLYKGKSVNNFSFLLAVLAQEKLVRVMEGKKREHEILDPSGFIAKVEKLIASGVNVKVKEPAKTVRSTTKKSVKKAAVKKTVTKSSTKKAAIKKRSVSRRKKTLTG